MSSMSGKIVIKVNDELKLLMKQVETIYTWKNLSDLFELFEFKPHQELDYFQYIDDIKMLEAEVESCKISGNYVVLCTSGFAWGDLAEIFLQVPNLQFWAYFSNSNGVEQYFSKTKKQIFEGCVVWDGSMNPEEEKEIAELRWFGLMNKTIAKFFISNSEVEEKLNKASEYKKKKKEVDYWSEFYKKHSKDSLLFKLKVEDPYERKFLVDTLNALNREENPISLLECKERLNSKFSNDWNLPLNDEHIKIFDAIYKRTSYIKEEDLNVYIGAPLQDSTMFLGDEEDAACGYSNGKDFISYSMFFMKLSNDFYGKVYSSKLKEYFDLTVVDGSIYLT